MKTADRQFLFSSWLRVGCACLVLGAITAGCATTAPRRSADGAEADHAAPGPAQFGPAPVKIVSVNPEFQFVVIDFSSRVMPPVGTRLNVYRGDKNVGMVRITEPVRARLATADILQGEIHVGDEAH